MLGVLRQAGTTSILVTHDQDEALSMADQVAVLRHGVIAQLDTPAGLYGHPEDAELAQFLGESNVLEGEVRDGVATTGLGRLAVLGLERTRGGRAATVMVRPEQIALGEPTGGGSRGRWPATSTSGTTRWCGSGRAQAGCPIWSCGSRAVPRSNRDAGSGSPCSGPVVAWPAEVRQTAESPE